MKNTLKSKLLSFEENNTSVIFSSAPQRSTMPFRKGSNCCAIRRTGCCCIAKVCRVVASSASESSPLEILKSRVVQSVASIFRRVMRTTLVWASGSLVVHSARSSSTHGPTTRFKLATITSIGSIDKTFPNMYIKRIWKRKKT